ncbi:MAG: amino acid ABC transporter ATP-binding protein [Verrucomicrobiota bacterium]
MIRVEDLAKSFGPTRVLQGVSHVQSAGQCAVIIGPSGCGKSTFLRCLNRLERPDSGRVTIDDLTLDASHPAGSAEERQLRLRAGMVFQQFHLFPHRTALENVLEGPLHILRHPRAEAEAAAHALLAKVGLADRAHHRPAQLSGGQQQRVAIARALAMQPRVMLIDEPTSALDPERRGEVLRVLRQLGAEGMTLVIVTHEMAFAREMADQVLFFEEGRVAESGPPEQVFGDPRHERTRAFLRAHREP